MKKIKILLAVLGISIGLTGCSLPSTQSTTAIQENENQTDVNSSKENNTEITPSVEEATVYFPDGETIQVESYSADNPTPLTDEEIADGCVYILLDDNYNHCLLKAQIVHHTYEYYIDGQNYNIKIDEKHGCCCGNTQGKMFISGHYQHTILVEYDCLHLEGGEPYPTDTYTYDGQTMYKLPPSTTWSCPNCPGKTHEDDYDNAERTQP